MVRGDADQPPVWRDVRDIAQLIREQFGFDALAPFTYREVYLRK
jgi:hypothetical protein